MQIKGSEKTSLTGAWLVLLLPVFILCFFCGWAHMPLLFIKPGSPNPLTVILGLVILALLARAIWETIRLKRFGDPALDLTYAPVPLGGTVEGRISLGSGLTTAATFNLKLQCIRRVLRQYPKNSHWEETVIWAGGDTAQILPGGIIPVSLTVPPDQEETNTEDPVSQILWRLNVQARFRGPSFLEKYEIPVRGRAAAEAIAEKRARMGQQTSNAKPRVVAILPFLVIGLALFCGGIYLLFFGVDDLTKASQSESWPMTTGRITNSTPPRSNAIFVSLRDSDFAYTFEVNGRTYAGHTVYPHVFWRCPTAQNIIKTHPLGSNVGVYYSPNDPANSCLVPGLRASAFQRVLTALEVLTFGFLFAASAALAPRDATTTGNSLIFRNGTTGSKVMGYSFLALIVGGVALWSTS